MRERAGEPERVSDADAAVVGRQLAAAEPLTEVPPHARAELVTVAPPDQLAAEVEALLDARICDPDLRWRRWSLSTYATPDRADPA